MAHALLEAHWPAVRRLAEALCRRPLPVTLPGPLVDLLDAHDQQAILVHSQALADYARFPEDRRGHHYPWPLV
jgi:hypothetical protein